MLLRRQRWHRKEDDVERKIETKELAAQVVLGIRFHTSMAKIGEDVGKGFGSLFAYLGELGKPPAGPPFALYYGEEFDPNDIDMEVCVPVAGVLDGKGEIEGKELPGGKAVSTIHKGPYTEVAGVYKDLEAWVKENGYSYAGPAREIYLNDPDQVESEADLLTEVLFPITK